MMFVDRGVAAARTYDVAVIGSGPSALCFALEFEALAPGCSILIIEAGGSKDNAAILDDTIVVENLQNHHPPNECTNKGLGGTSATWGGRCVMYDHVDFVKRQIVNGGCTWDDSVLREAEPYVSRTQELFECGVGAFDLSTVIGGYRPIAENFIRGIVDDSVIERWSMPTRFGVRYRSHLYNSRSISVLEHTIVEQVSEDSDQPFAVEIRVAPVETGPSYQLHANRVIIAAGAQETTRILLKSDSLFLNIGGPSKALGHYYQGHVSGKIASVRFYGSPEKTDYGFQRDSYGAFVRRRWQLSEDTIVDKNLLNVAMWLDNPQYFDPAHRNGAMSLMYLAMLMPWVGPKLAPPAVAYSVTKGQRVGLFRHLGNVLWDLPGSVICPLQMFIDRYLRKRKLPGVFLYNKQNRYAVHFHSEQIPRYENEMTLSDDRKTLVIRYAVSREDAQAIVEAHRVLDAWLREKNCGELEYWYPEDTLVEKICTSSRDGVHQSGTTRIADSPEHGVVDRDLRVFGTKKVYVCSSSVLPTSGQANPTFFVGVLAVRLAHHLSSLCDT